MARLSELTRATNSIIPRLTWTSLTEQSDEEAVFKGSKAVR